MVITSGHRPKWFNDTVPGAAKDSEHLYNAPGKGAVDVKVVGADPLEVERWILENWKESVGKG